LLLLASVSLLPAAGFCTFVVSGGLSPVQPRPITHGDPPWVFGVGLIWLATYVAGMAAALLPAHGQVMPDGRRARRYTLGAMLLLVGVSVLSAWHGADLPPLPAALEPPGPAKCIAGAMIGAIMPLVAGLVALRAVRPVRPWTVGAALGVAGGALGGLHLHLACPVVGGGLTHFLVGHAGAIFIASALGALASTWLARKNR
jgi:hypothetical protein